MAKKDLIEAIDEIHEKNMTIDQLKKIILELCSDLVKKKRGR